MFSNRFTLADHIYESFVNMVVALTNFHVTLMPLRTDDRQFDARYNEQIRRLYNEAVQRHRQRNKRIAETRRVRLQVAVETNGIAGNPEALQENNNDDSGSN